MSDITPSTNSPTSLPPASSERVWPEEKKRRETEDNALSIASNIASIAGLENAATQLRNIRKLGWLSNTWKIVKEGKLFPKKYEGSTLRQLKSHLGDIAKAVGLFTGTASLAKQWGGAALAKIASMVGSTPIAQLATQLKEISLAGLELGGPELEAFRRITGLLKAAEKSVSSLDFMIAASATARVGLKMAGYDSLLNVLSIVESSMGLYKVFQMPIK